MLQLLSMVMFVMVFLDDDVVSCDVVCYSCDARLAAHVPRAAILRDISSTCPMSDGWRSTATFPGCGRQVLLMGLVGVSA